MRKMRIKIVALAVMVLVTTIMPYFSATDSVRVSAAGTYGDTIGGWVGTGEPGNVIIDNGVGNALDHGSGALINLGSKPPTNLIQLPNGGGVLVTNTPTAGLKWYNNPAIGTVGKFIKVGGFFIGSYDTLNDAKKLWTYQSPANYTTTEAAIDKGLYYTDVGMGLYAIGKGALIFGGTIVAGGTVGWALVSAAGATAGLYAVTRLGVQATRAFYNAGYFGAIRDGAYSGWQTFKGGMVRTGGYLYGGWQTFKGGVISVGSMAGGGLSWLYNGLMGASVNGILGSLGYGVEDGLFNEIPDPGTGIGVYKPNIYIYSDKDINMNVLLSNEEYITASKPLYKNGSGWTAEIRNGSISGSGDYLFYEAFVPDSGFQKNSGWVVRSGSLEKDISQILRIYGFNSREKADFIDYWAPVLSGNADYVFYPQETSVVDSIMPLKADPQPGSTCRIWFYIEPYTGAYVNTPVSVDAIKTHRNALIEWGGVYRPDNGK